MKLTPLAIALARVIGFTRVPLACAWWHRMVEDTSDDALNYLAMTGKIVYVTYPSLIHPLPGEANYGRQPRSTTASS